MNLKTYFCYLIIILISFSCNSPTDGDGGTTTTGGDGSTTTGGDCGDCPLSLSLGNISDNSIEILLTTPQDISGFQFNIVGAVISGASGGLASDAGFTVSTGTDMVLGFSIVGNVIPAGSSGVLTNLEYTSITPEVCFDGVVLSDPEGNAIQNNESDCDWVLK